MILQPIEAAVEEAKKVSQEAPAEKAAEAGPTVSAKVKAGRLLLS